jgi:hypothetical protein
METNEVYDIINGLSTFFLWPGDLINSHSYSYSDLFNINNDRTIMVTSGVLYLAFNFVSMVIDEKIQENVFSKIESPYFKNGNNFTYFCYKISNYKSILESIFEKDNDKGRTVDGLVDSDEQNDAIVKEEKLIQDFYNA